MNLARTHEQTLHRTFYPAVEKRIDLVGQLATLVPCATIIVTAEEHYTIWILPSGTTVDGLAANTEHHHLRTLPVGHDGTVAKGIAPRRLRILHIVFVAGSVSQDSLRAPREAIVLAQPVVQVDGPIADVATAIAVVGNGNQCSVAARGDGRNAIGHPSFNRLKQSLGASGLCMAAHRSKCQKQDGQ